jgi:hypothetical protein
MLKCVQYNPPIKKRVEVFFRLSFLFAGFSGDRRRGPFDDRVFSFEQVHPRNLDGNVGDNAATLDPGSFARRIRMRILEDAACRKRLLGGVEDTAVGCPAKDDGPPVFLRR